MSRPGKIQIDAYFKWAIDTGFRHFPAPDDVVSALVEFKSELTDHARKLMAQAPGTVWVSARYVGFRFANIRLSKPHLQDQLKFLFDRLDAERLELSMPLSPGEENVDVYVPPLACAIRPNFVGVIDDGCPFAHQDYLSFVEGKWKTQIGILWDQSARTAGSGASIAAPFGYGAAFFGEQLDELIAKSSTSASQPVDEDSVYAKARLFSLRGLTSHGAHVLGHAVGYRKASTRMSSDRLSDGSANKPPTWRRDEKAKSISVGFVQLPKAALNDPSGRWLGGYVLDGIHMLLNYAASLHAKRRVINVSYGPQTGPHDGGSLLERAIDELVATRDHKPQTTFIALPAGNSYLSRAHATFELGSVDSADTTLVWHVAPASELPVFCEVWLPPTIGLEGVKVEIKRPSGQAFTAKAQRTVSSPDGVVDIVAIDVSTRATMVLIAIAPTARSVTASDTAGAPVAPLGKWQLQIRTKQPKCTGKVHVYLSRNDFNMGGARRGHAGYFSSPNYDADRFQRANEYLDISPQNMPAAADIAPEGTLSGLATGQSTSVAGGYVVATGKPARYSSGGPSRGVMRSEPDLAYPSDESCVYGGLLGAGNRSAAVFRMGGTSVASPQYANDLARGVVPKLKTSDFPKRAGKGLC